TSIDVERLFSCGRILLPHTQNCLSAQSARALLCLSCWSPQGFVKDTDLQNNNTSEEIESDEDVELAAGWDSIEIE
ncbi:hypothetical protein SCLCIDRAFT_105860, partial [Scleroderma citrinum Foug A]